MKNVRTKQACGLLRRIFGVGARARSSRPARKLMLAALVLAVATFEVVPAVATAQQDDGAISALTLTSDTPGTLDVSWEAPTGAAPTDYRVNWARSGEDYPPWTDNTANLHPTTTSQQLTDLDEDVEYKVRVRARYHDGPWSGPWAEATRQVAAQPVVQAQQDDGAISALTLTSDTPGTLDVSWDAPTGAAPTDYRVNWARSGEDYPPWTDNTANLHPTTTSQQLTDLDEDVEYKVRVRARYHDGPWSGPWAEATRQVAAQPSLGVRSADDPPTTQDTPPTVTTPQRVPRSTPRSDTPSKSAPIRTITEGQSTTFARRCPPTDRTSGGASPVSLRTRSSRQVAAISVQMATSSTGTISIRAIHPRRFSVFAAAPTPWRSSPATAASKPAGTRSGLPQPPPGKTPTTRGRSRLPISCTEHGPSPLLSTGRAPSTLPLVL